MLLSLTPRFVQSPRAFYRNVAPTKSEVDVDLFAHGTSIKEYVLQLRAGMDTCFLLSNNNVA